MKNWKLKNDDNTPVKDILEQFKEMRPLPMGRKEFDVWADRIISGALVPTTDRDSLIFTLADVITHLGPTESHKPDAYFIHILRKYAVNEVAVAVRKEMHYKRHPEKLAELEAKEKASAAVAEKTLDRVGDFQTQ